MNHLGGCVKMGISIIDYGMGNIKSVVNAFQYLDSNPRVVDSPKDLTDEKIVIPGVGAFGGAMEKLEPFASELTKAVELDKPILGICLGLQAFFKSSYEAPDKSGLSFLEGNITKINTDLKLPHIGWNSLQIKNDECPLFKGISEGHVYYAHTYHANPEQNVTVATSSYGEDIVASVWEDNIFGVQFHPEKSGELGLKIIENFLEV